MGVWHDACRQAREGAAGTVAELCHSYPHPLLSPWIFGKLLHLLSPRAGCRHPGPEMAKDKQVACASGDNNHIPSFPHPISDV